MAWKYRVNGREVTQEEWDALPKRGLEGGAPMVEPSWDPDQTVYATGEKMTREEWNAWLAAEGRVEASKADLRNWTRKRRPRPSMRECAEKARLDRQRGG